MRRPTVTLQEAQSLAGDDDQQLLEFFMARWSRFHQSSTVLGSVFEYSKELMRGEQRCPYTVRRRPTKQHCHQCRHGR